jgi:hypothetical protein
LASTRSRCGTWGAWRASSLAAVGRIEALAAEALTTADLLFGTQVAAWCGTFF